ncbi:MAG: nicotinate-nucleotide pyrophosphorylase [Methanosaeta sp. PtaB.Bin039]|nr:MAG: nicotinate-nucleotide pyrophosphorylase [Methanosaeta sp. PtaB.Bin039]OPY44582.1 MAG: nicotinate-nucleotide pyrophosphorylase [Methanosaeta sp. PtaU1.Bin028]
MLRSDIERFIQEDLGEWDDGEIVPAVQTEAVIIAREEGVVCGLEEAALVFKLLGAEAQPLFDDGEFVTREALVMSVSGSARQILRAERLALNFLGRMSGIATLTRRCVLLARPAKVACTRKTTPGFRRYEKRAVLAGGGDPHRFSLSGAVMIKDNHLKVMDLEEAMSRARREASFTKKIEVEVEDLGDMLRAAEFGADIIMFDNMNPEAIKRGVDMLESRGWRSRVVLEASGGIGPEDLPRYAATGVDVISMGSLTRDARWMDFSLEMNGKESKAGIDY